MTVVVAMLITLLLVVFYLRSSVPKAADDTARGRTAIDGAREQARRAEEVQRERLRELDSAANPP